MQLIPVSTAYPFTSHSWLWPAPGVNVVEVLLAPMNTLSKTSSLPARPVTSTVAVGSLVAEPAPAGVPRGVVWSTLAKFAAPAMAPLVTAPEKVMTTSPVTPLGRVD